MTREEIRKILDNTKVYVNGKSKEIQEKLFSFGYSLARGGRIIGYTDMPFLFIHNKTITCGNDMEHFIKDKNKEITAEEILSIKVTEPSYRPFKTKEECWNEMLKHQPFGWLKSKNNESYICVGNVWWSEMLNDIMITFYTIELMTFTSCSVFEDYTFADGTPFGIKQE